VKHAIVVGIAVTGLTALSAAQGATTVRTLLPADKDALPVKVRLSTELVSFFDRNGCELPEKLKKKLTENGNIGLIPADLRETLGAELGADVYKIPGTSVNAVLHAAEFQIPGAAAPETVTLTGTGTYKRLNAMSLIDPLYNNFAYTMDCSGFLNAAIATGGGIKAAQIESSAKLALQSQKSMLAVRALVNSPVAMAISPDMFSDSLLRQERVELLYALIAEIHQRHPNAPEDTGVTSWRQQAILWTSNKGSSSLQGVASFSASGSAGLGVFSGSANMTSGSVVGRNISFSNFDTYIIESSLDKSQVKTTLKNLYDTVEKLVNNATVTIPTKKLDKTYLVSFALPPRLCGKDWTLKSVKTKAALAGTITSEWKQGGCDFVLAPEQALAADERGILIQAPAGYKNLEYVLPVALN